MIMMANPNKKKIATVIVEKLAGPKESPVESEKAETDDSVALKAAAEKMLKAIEAKSADQLASAMQDFQDIIRTEDMEQDQAEEA